MRKTTAIRVLLGSSAAAMALASAPAFAQDGQPGSSQAAAAPNQTVDQPADQGTTGPGDIIVTARRVEERLQDVPISITAFNQQQLTNRNIVSGSDLATYTPSLQANSNFGSDNTSFAIRGFAQDIGTAPSVGTYFGDVVVPRGASNGQPIGDGVLNGQLFDLQNVQVLKGPQGTLFGRNTTGGAVLIVPQKPTDRLEGYVEGSIGNYDLRRIQAVINIPLSDNLRIRAGVDRMVRKGYLNNISGIGPRDFSNVDYWAARLSVVADITPDIENYTIASYIESKSRGGLSQLIAANAGQGSITVPVNPFLGGNPANPCGGPIPGCPTVTVPGFGALAAAQLARQNASGDPYAVENAIPDAGLKTRQWQVINNTSWRATDGLTIRNIFSYAELRQGGVNPIFGNRFIVPYNGVNYNTDFQTSVSPPGLYTANESTLTEELRLEGNSDRLTWQAGAYLEVVHPLSDVGSQSPGFANCQSVGTFGNDFRCNDPIGGWISSNIVSAVFPFTGLPAAAFPFFAANFPPNFVPIGNINYTVGRTAFHDVGLYAQATFKVSDQFKITGGFRYTWDRESINTVQRVYQLVAPPAFGVASSGCTNVIVATAPACFTRYETKSSAPTWLIDVDYTPTPDLLVYAKYARGYRSATIAPNIPEGGTAANPDTSLNYIRPEKVDAFELGLKSSFRGAVPGTFNVAAFYNKFSDQQLQVGFLPINPGLFPQTAAPVNAGKSTIYGLEVEASLRPFRGLQLDASYAYLHTRIDQVNALPSNFAYNTQAAFVVGDEEVLAPRHKLTVSANYTLPLDESVGRLSIGGSVTYRSRMLVNYIDRANPDPSLAALSYVPALTLVNANVSWEDAGGLPIDLNFFVTNLTNQKYYNYVAGLGSTQLGFENGIVGEPRMYGVRLRVKFRGSEHEALPPPPPPAPVEEVAPPPPPPAPPPPPPPPQPGERG